MAEQSMKNDEIHTKNVAFAGIDLMELRLLLENLRKSIKFWFLNGTSLDIIQTSCVDILKHGLNIENNWQIDEPPKCNDALRKFIDELEWLRRSSLIRDVDFCECAAEPTKNPKAYTIPTLQNFLADWTLRNLDAKTMCASIQALVTEKELLQNYYDTSAFLRNESYVTAFGISLTALELNQCSLLSQIDESLFHVNPIKNDYTDGGGATSKKHKRTSSHPNFSLASLKPKEISTEMQTMEETKTKSEAPKFKIESAQQSTTVFPVFRKVKSFPTIPTFLNEESQNSENNKQRPRSKTMIMSRRPPPKPNLQKNTENKKLKSSKIPIIKRKFEHFENATYLQTASASLNSCNSQTSNSTNDSFGSINVSTSPSSHSHSTGSSSVETKARRIEVINCDDIKIWTDQSVSDSTCCSKSKLANKYIPPPPRSPVPIIKTKNISPMNSLLSTLFGTPPTYSKWYIGETNFEQASPALDTTRNANEIHNNSSSFCNLSAVGGGVGDVGGGGSVFDVFMPVYGQKVHLKSNAKTLFEEGISTLDYKRTDVGNLKRTDNNKENINEAPSTSVKRTEPNCQSLTTFLQNAHLSRNNTELEKENAHFRISEAIISAIEHIKWAKSQPRQRRESEAIVATDWLETEHKNLDSNNKESQDGIVQTEETILTDSNEYLPYAELGDNRYETMSAEVVGLSLISKFNDQHLPKVSELKWLVSDEDTPQQLLPMPDNSPTANPDEHIFPPMTRGTRYWAPPRPQIIFTDHPIPNRKELIRKQNSRCAGCGMRVSQQNMNSFRYCTYFGKYHCTGCHRNQMSATPAKILQNWDFKCYPVSVFAYRLLEQMYTFPLFHVPDLNPALYIKSKQLLEARNKRLKLKFIKDFIKSCRFATSEQTYFETIPDYIPNDPDTWSMSDFVDARNESMQRSINEIIEKCENHIFFCVLCTGRGFCCEYCLANQVIFPWNNKVFRCDHCGSCFHLNCWKATQEICCRCQRKRNRQSEIAEAINNDQ